MAVQNDGVAPLVVHRRRRERPEGAVRRRLPRPADRIGPWSVIEGHIDIMLVPTILYNGSYNEGAVRRQLPQPEGSVALSFQQNEHKQNCGPAISCKWLVGLKISYLEVMVTL